MSRDHRKLKVFQEADRLIVPTYRATAHFPVEERFGLQSQIRRAAISIPTNLVESCARTSEAEFRHFVSITLGSASELAYLLDVSSRLGYMTGAESLIGEWTALIPALKRLHATLGTDAGSTTPRTKDQGPRT